MSKYANLSADKWYRDLLEDIGKIPFSFTYDGKKYIGFKGEEFSLINKEVSINNNKETVDFSIDFKGELTLKLKLTHYFSHGVTEWTVVFENNTDKNSGILEEIGTKMELDGEKPVLKGILGDHENYYRPYEKDLSQESVNFASNSGRATHVNFPYFNLECGDGGAILVIGWAGTWTADFVKKGDKTEYSAKAVNNLKSYLKPGEKIRSALFVYAPYSKRDEDYATNFWRSWYIEHNLPKMNAQGEAPEPFSTCCFAFDTGLVNSDGSISERHTTWKPTMDKMIEEDVKVDFRWFDAGWYVAPDGTSAESFVKGHDWWDTVGTWTLDPVKWPEGTFLESTEYARKNGMKTLVWFEPERVTDPKNLTKSYGYKMDWAIDMKEGNHPNDGSRILISNNIGIPECFDWTVGQICKMLRENKIEMYREDNNCNPAELWAYLDSKENENREGITECKFIDGHYRMWDEIIACTLSYGGCGFVDSCASGGGRNDLESMRRGIPLLRSDLDRKTTAIRLSMTTSFNKWIPFCGANTREKTAEHATTGISDKYVWRASYLATLNVDSQFVYDPTQNFDILRFGLKEWKKVNPYILKDMYTLTPWHEREETDNLISYTYYDPETKKGVLFAFCQENCPERELSVKLPFVKESESCVLVDEDTKEEVASADGKIDIKFSEAREAKLYFYEVR